MTLQHGTTRKRRSGALAVLDRSAGRWRLVLDRSARGAGPESITLDDGEVAKLSERLTQAGVTRLVRVVPASECVAKLEPVPEASGEELVAALGLLAESALPEDATAHRRGVGVIGTASDGWALTAAWLARDSAAPKIALHGIEETWIAEPAALLAFARPETRAILAWDREQSSVLAARLAGDKPVVRCIRLDGTDNTAWKRGLAAAAAFASVDADLEASSGVATAGPLLASGWSNVPASALTGEFAAALGALRIAAGDATLAPLASMRRESDDGREPATIRAARWVSSPRRAAGIIAAAIGVMLLAPVVSAYARLKIFEHKLGSIAEARAQSEQVDKQAALYAQFEKTRWPMTKLMADVMNAAPVGVSFESFAIEREGDQGVTIKGFADSSEALSSFQRNLNETGVLGAARVSQLAASGSSISFSLAAKIASPRNTSRLKEDFGKSPLADRSGSSRSRPSEDTHTASASGSDTHAAPSDSTRTDNREARGGRGNGGGRTERGNGGGGAGGERTPPRDNEAGRAGRGETASSGETNKAAKPFVVPPPLTDAEINAMDKSAASKAWTDRIVARGKSEVSPADKARIEEEIKKLDPIRKGEAPKPADPPPADPPPAQEPAHDAPASGGDK